MSTANKEIIIDLIKPTFTLGEHVELAVSYRNISDVPISFPDPARTWLVGLNVTAENGTTQRVHFGKKMRYRTENGAEASSFEQVNTITLEPGAAHRFSFPIYERCPDLFPLGKHTLAVVDLTEDNHSLSSNQLATTMVFSAMSVPLLLDELATATNAPFRREWASLWLQELNPNFAPPLISDSDPDAEEADVERLMSEEIEKYRTWWNTFRTSRDLADAVARVNAAHVEL